MNQRRHAEREEHEQRVTLADAKLPQKFDHTQFVGYVDPTSIKFDKFATLAITFRVPPEYRDLAMSLIDAGGTLLSIDVQRWNVVPLDKDDDA